MSAFRKNQGEKTEAAKQSIICLIRDLKLKKGDKIPTQNELRTKLGVGSVTIQRAIDTLTESGILEVRPHKGVFVKNQETDGFVARHIGLVSMWQTFSPYTASLIQCLQLKLHQNACQCKFFLRSFPERTEKDFISFFDGLKRCIEQKEIQGLITTVSFDDEEWDFFKKHNIPVVSLSTAVYNEGFKVGYSNAMPEYFKLASVRGYSRPALLHCGYPSIEPTRDEFKKHCSLDHEIYCRFMNLKMELDDKPLDWTEKLHNILEEFSNMPHDTRPDVLLIPDDIITSIAHRKIQNMQLNGSDWDPYFIYATSRQIPILPHGSIKGDCFEYDIMENAEATIKLLINIICGKEKEPRQVYVQPKHFYIKEIL